MKFQGLTPVSYFLQQGYHLKVPQLSPTVPLPDDQVFRHMSLLGTVHIQTTIYKHLN